jgi:hypothetical protein
MPGRLDAFESEIADFDYVTIFQDAEFRDPLRKVFAGGVIFKG